MWSNDTWNIFKSSKPSEFNDVLICYHLFDRNMVASCPEMSWWPPTRCPPHLCRRGCLAHQSWGWKVFLSQTRFEWVATQWMFPVLDASFFAVRWGWSVSKKQSEDDAAFDAENYLVWVPESHSTGFGAACNHCESLQESVTQSLIHESWFDDRASPWKSWFKASPTHGFKAFWRSGKDTLKTLDKIHCGTREMSEFKSRPISTGAVIFASARACDNVKAKCSAWRGFAASMQSCETRRSSPLGWTNLRCSKAGKRIIHACTIHISLHTGNWFEITLRLRLEKSKDVKTSSWYFSAHHSLAPAARSFDIEEGQHPVEFVLGNQSRAVGEALALWLNEVSPGTVTDLSTMIIPVFWLSNEVLLIIWVMFPIMKSCLELVNFDFPSLPLC